MKTDHDREDLIELPHFINFPSDQGLIADEEMTENVLIESMKETEKASASTAPAQAALEQVEIHGVQSGVSLIQSYPTYFAVMTTGLLQKKLLINANLVNFEVYLKVPVS